MTTTRSENSPSEERPETSWAAVTDELSDRPGAMAHHPNTNRPLLHDKAYS